MQVLLCIIEIGLKFYKLFIHKNINNFSSCDHHSEVLQVLFIKKNISTSLSPPASFSY